MKKIIKIDFFLFLIFFQYFPFFQNKNYPSIGVRLLDLHSDQKIREEVNVNKFFNKNFSLPIKDELNFYEILKKTQTIRKAKKLLQFILEMRFIETTKVEECIVTLL